VVGGLVHLRWHSNNLHLELSFDDKLARCQQIIYGI